MARSRRRRRAGRGRYVRAGLGVALGVGIVVAILRRQKARLPPGPGQPGHLDLSQDEEQRYGVDVPEGGFPHVARLSAYWPVGPDASEEERRREGPPVDVHDRPLYSLQDYLAGKAPFVSIAADRSRAGFPRYGELVRIEELEKRYGRKILFRVVDTGGSFMTTGTTRFDIRVASRDEGLKDEVNSDVHYWREGASPSEA